MPTTFNNIRNVYYANSKGVAPFMPQYSSPIPVSQAGLFLQQFINYFPSSAYMYLFDAGTLLNFLTLNGSPTPGNPANIQDLCIVLGYYGATQNFVPMFCGVNFNPATRTGTTIYSTGINGVYETVDPTYKFVGNVFPNELPHPAQPMGTVLPKRTNPYRNPLIDGPVPINYSGEIPTATANSYLGNFKAKYANSAEAYLYDAGTLYNFLYASTAYSIQDIAVVLGFDPGSNNFVPLLVGIDVSCNVIYKNGMVCETVDPTYQIAL
jgi:hypothetical protein